MTRTRIQVLGQKYITLFPLVAMKLVCLRRWMLFLLSSSQMISSTALGHHAPSSTPVAGAYIFHFAPFPPGGGGKNMTYWLVVDKNMMTCKEKARI